MYNTPPIDLLGWSEVVLHNLTIHSPEQDIIVQEFEKVSEWKDQEVETNGKFQMKQKYGVQKGGTNVNFADTWLSEVLSDLLSSQQEDSVTLKKMWFSRFSIGEKLKRVTMIDIISLIYKGNFEH